VESRQLKLAADIRTRLNGFGIAGIGFQPMPVFVNP
jgi:hypothetical protein